MQRIAPGYVDRLVGAGFRIDHVQPMAGRGRDPGNGQVAATGSGGDIAPHAAQQRQQRVTFAGRGVDEAVHRDQVRVDPALEMRMADADAAGLDQEADRIAQAGDVASGVRHDSAHRHLQVVHVVGRRVIPRVAKLRGVERSHQRLAEHRVGGFGDRRRRFDTVAYWMTS